MLDFFHHTEEPPRKKRGWGFFWWSILLMLSAATCFASWVGSFYVISHPEEPRCYRILKKLNRLDPPRRFEVTKAPEGKFLTPTRLLERYGKLGPANLAAENAELLRAYLMNFRESKSPPTYIAGRFEVTATHALGHSDFFRSGAVAVAQAKDQSQFLIECVFSADAKVAPQILELLPTGGEIILERSHDVWALVHVARLEDGRMQFTAVPLSYGSWRIKKGGSFSLKSPEELEKQSKALALNIDAGLPVIRGERLAKGLDAYSAFRRKLLANAGDDDAALAGPELVRFDPARATSPAPPARVIHLPTAPAPLTSNDPAALRARPTPAPAVPLAPRAIVRNAPPDVPPPPPLRVLSASAASALVEKFDASQPTVLTGDFVVTGVLGQRVALRTMESLRDRAADPTAPGTSAALIVVDFAAGRTPPGKNSTLTREAKDGFVIRDVIRGNNGQITIVTESP